MNRNFLQKSLYRRWSPGAVLATFCAALIILVSGQLFAQAGIDTGGITGTVKDPTGALVVGASCTLTNTATGEVQRAVSTSAGAYSFPLVPVGTYSLKLDAKGFEESLVTGIVVHLGNTITEDVSLRIGSANAEVTVTSAAPLLQAQDASLGTTFDTAAATELPLFAGSGGRNFQNLITLAAGVQFTGSNASTGTFLVHGVASIGEDVRLNGADDNVEVFGGVAIPPIPDTIQEMKLEDGNNSADIGEFYGPVLNVVTKSGTNKFEGSVWEYNENDMYNANDYFNKLHQVVTNSNASPANNRPGRYKENEFGGVFGGPIIIPHLFNGRNKTFFTIDAQRTDYTQTDAFTSTVPTSGMQNSGFTDLSDTLKLNYQAAGGTGNPQSSMKEDALDRWFQVGTMLDPGTTRWLPCTAGSVDPITNLPVDCTKGYVTTNPSINGGAQFAVVRDPFLATTAGGQACPSLTGTKVFNSAYNGGNGSQPTAPAQCFNQLPQGRLDPNAIALLKLFPGPNQQNASSLTYSNNFYRTVIQPTNTTQYDVRVDHNLSDKDTLLGTWSYYLQTTTGGMPLPGILEGGSGSGNFANQTDAYEAVVSETHVFSPNLLNVFRFSWTHQLSDNWDPGNIDNQVGIPAQYNIPGIPQGGGFGLGNGGLPDFGGMSGLSAFGSRSNITYRSVGAWGYSDSITKIKGKHEIKVGGQWLWTYGNIAQLPTSRGSFGYGGFSNVPNSGDGNANMADFLLLPATNIASGAYTTANPLSTGTMSGANPTGNVLGGASSFGGNNDNLSDYAAPYLAFYGVDTWKATPSLTFSLGLREEWFGPYYASNGEQANLWLGGNGNQASGTALYIAHNGCSTTMSPYVRGLLAYDNIPIICEAHNNANETPMANWSPRLGVAYRVTPKLVVRAGAGIAYNGFGSVGYGGTLGTNYPFRFTVQQGPSVNAYTPSTIGAANNVTSTMENTFAIIDLTNPAQAVIPYGSLKLYGKQYHFHEPHVKTLNAAVQYQFTNHDSVQVQYVASIGQNLESADPYNNALNELLTPNTQASSTSCANAANPYCATSPAMANDPSATVVPFPNMAVPVGPMETTEQVSNYQSGEVEYQHQFAFGFNMNSNYVFAKCLSDAQGGQQNEGGPANGRAPWVTGYRYDYDRCENLAENMFKLSGEYSLPFGKGSYIGGNANALENAIIGGWKLDPAFIASSGFLANISCQGANGYTGFGAPSATFTGPWLNAGGAYGCNAPMISGSHLYGPGANDKARTRTTGYWNSAAWSAPGPVTQNGQADWSPLGVRGNQIYGPGWYDIDFNLHKAFQTTESTRLEVGAQAMNAFNHVQLNNPGTSNYTTPSSESLTGGFGTITGDRGIASNEGRVIEFSGKFFF